MSKAGWHEVDYYPEIMQYVKEQIESNFAASGHSLKVYCKTGELRKGLQAIINENGITTPSIVKFAASTPPLSLDIFGLITDGVDYQLLIMEIKLRSSIGLTELSQLLGYCVVSDANYGLLINIEGGVSPRLTDLLQNEPGLFDFDIEKKRRTRTSHKFGVMTWDSETQVVNYTGYGGIRTMGELCKLIAARFK